MEFNLVCAEVVCSHSASSTLITYAELNLTVSGNGPKNTCGRKYPCQISAKRLEICETNIELVKAFEKTLIGCAKNAPNNSPPPTGRPKIAQCKNARNKAKAKVIGSSQWRRVRYWGCQLLWPRPTVLPNLVTKAPYRLGFSRVPKILDWQTKKS